MLETHQSLSSNANIMAGRASICTDDLAPSQRLATWRSLMCLKWNVDVDPDDDVVFDAGIDLLTFDRCLISDVISSRARYYLDPEYLGQAEDAIDIVLAKQGRIRGRQRGRDIVIGPDQAMALLATEVSSIDLLDSRSAFKVIRLPVSQVSPRVADLAMALACPLDSDRNSIDLVDKYADGLLSLTSPITPKLATMSTEHLSELVGLTLESLHRPHDQRDGRPVRSIRRQAAKAYVIENIASQSLNPAKVAKHIGVTERYLRKLFADDGLSFSSLVRSLRVQEAHRLLSDPSLLNSSITNIAYRVGFADISYFNQCFRAEYNQKPSDIRDRTMLVAAKAAKMGA